MDFDSLYQNSSGGKTVIQNPRYLQDGPGYKMPRPDVREWLKSVMPDSYHFEVYSDGCDIVFDDAGGAALYKLTFFGTAQPA